MVSQLAPLALQGFAFGWSVAWPPGPINAEIARRAIAAGALSALAVALGAGSGDALWAALTSLGAGLFLNGAAARLVLGWTSTVLLLALAALFLGGAWRALRGGDRMVAPRPFERGRMGYALGLGMSLTSPWNIGFWVAVMGRPELAQMGVLAALVMAGAVLTGAFCWCLVLVGSLTLFRIRIDAAWWETLAKGATGALMLGFAIRGMVSLLAG